MGDTQSTAAQEKSKDGIYLGYKMRLEIGRRYFVDESINNTGETGQYLTQDNNKTDSRSEQ